MNILAFCQFEGGYSTSFRQKLSQIAREHKVLYASDYQWTEKEYHTALEEAEIILSYFPKTDLQYCRSLKLLLLDIAGVDGYIDSLYLPKNTIVCNATGAYGNILAEHALAMALALCRDIPLYVHNMSNRMWQMHCPDKPVEGSKILILGAGDIGTAIARNIRPLIGKGTITGVRRIKRAIPPQFDDMITFDELERELPKADFIFCALPQTAETQGLMNRRKLELIKEDAILINVGRGSLIPLDDLAVVLRNGRFRGVGIDVAEEEPLPPEHPIWNCERLIITPHAAGNAMTQESPTGQRLCKLMLKNLENYFAGAPMLNVVSRETGYRKTVFQE